MADPGAVSPPGRLCGYRASWPGILRIGFWCLLFLSSFGALIPRPLPDDAEWAEVLAGTHVIPVETYPGDERPVREDIPPHAKKNNIAWIADSGNLITPPGEQMDNTPVGKLKFLSRLVADKLENGFGLSDFDIRLFCELGRRPGAQFLYALQAIAEKPEAIVISLNPIWAFSSHQFFLTRDSLAMAPALLLPHPSLWHLIPLFVAPSQDLMALLGSRFSILREAFPYKHYLLQKTANVRRALTLGGGAARERPQDVITWDNALWITPDAKSPRYKNLEKSDDFLVAQNAFIGFNTETEKDTFSFEVFEAMLEALKESGIPTLIYTSPLEDRLYDDPESGVKLRRIHDYLEAAAEALRGTNVHLIPAVPEDVRHTITFIPRDGFHQWNPGQLVTYLAAEIMNTLKQGGTAPVTPEKKRKEKGEDKPDR